MTKEEHRKIWGSRVAGKRDALKALPPDQMDADVPAKEGLNFCNQLFSMASLPYAAEV
ncbi:MAG: hypothetical protein FD169_1632 [Bacillota bacterium]|nr:MAG: hypothetical protein FD169_1632 [Bacillota bacterium]